MRSSLPARELFVDPHRIDAVQLAKNLAEMNKNAPKPSIEFELSSIPEMEHRHLHMQEVITDRALSAGKAAEEVITWEKHCKELGKKIRALEKLTGPEAVGVGRLRRDLNNHRASLESAQDTLADWNRAYKTHSVIGEAAQKLLAAFNKDELPLLKRLLALRDLAE
jgi:hypothetical protein